MTMSLQKEKQKNKKSYPIRSIRLSEKTWEGFKKMRWKSGKGWEKFISDLAKKNGAD